MASVAWWSGRWAKGLAWVVAEIAVVAFVYRLGSAMIAKDEAFSKSLPARQKAGEAWAKRQGMKATVTCWEKKEECDVVPADLCGPFFIACNQHVCWLPTPVKQ